MDVAAKHLESRLLSLDALRGLAIFLMVLSGSIAFGDVMPAWMYHAQVPPPTHTFNPDLPGITWVDLVFPFFLFSMGAALPLALSKKLSQKDLPGTLLQITKRYILLLFFAIFTHHAKAWVMNASAGFSENALSIGCFFLLFLMLSKTNFETHKVSIARQISGFLLALTFLAFYPFPGEGFNIHKSDIIIVVLANMALFGSTIWILTKDRPWIRVAILPFVMAIFLSAKVTGSWTSTLFNWTPAPWAYTFYYLKYLFIIIPGTFVGDWLLQAKVQKLTIKTSATTFSIALLGILLVVLNTSLLFSRQLTLNLIFTISLLVAILFQCRKSGLSVLYQNFAYAGIFLLLLGLCFEPYEGGIKKDPSTYSYYFVCSGMAFLIIFSFILVEAAGYLKTTFKFMAQVGQNPMIAYTAGNLFLIPLMRLTNLEPTLNLLNQNAWAGLCRGLIFTSIVSLIAIFFTQKKVFWKT